MRPLSTFGPVGREPLKGGVISAYGDVRPGTNGAELLAVLEDAAAYGLFLDLGGSAVLVCDGDEMFNVQHSRIIGNLTGEVNGFLTGGQKYSERSKYRPC